MSKRYNMANQADMDELTALAASDEHTTYTPNGDGTFRAEGRFNCARVLINAGELNLEGAEPTLQGEVVPIDPWPQNFGHVQFHGQPMPELSAQSRRTGEQE